MGPLEIIGAGSGVINAGVGVSNAILGWQAYNENRRINERNYQMSLEQQSYDRMMQSRAWNREDTAIQRRVADLKAAGLNPVLAAGSGAQSSSPMHLNAPVREPIDPSSAMQGMEGLAKMGNVAQTMASLMATNAQIKKTTAEADLLEYSKFNAERDRQISILKDLVEDSRIGTEFQGRAGEALRQKLIEKYQESTAYTGTIQAQAQADKTRADSDVVERNLALAKERGVSVGSNVNDVADMYNFATDNTDGQWAIFLNLIMKALGNVVGNVR